MQISLELVKLVDTSSLICRDNIAIVLVEPITPGNIGSVARAMTNMGFNDLRLVHPIANPKAEEAYMLAHGATKLLEQAKIFDTLDEAVADCAFLVATSHKVNRDHKDSFTARELGRKLIPYCQNNKVAILFGREPSGLSNEEINRCVWLTHIPAAVSYPSLNLSQAVMIVCYELFLTSMDSSSVVLPKFVTDQELERFLQNAQQTLDLLGFQHKNEKPELFIGIMRRIFTRVGLENRDINALYKMFNEFRYLAQNKQK